MIAGIGIDLIEVQRVQEKIEKENGFREMIFSKQEIMYCEANKNKYEHYAARFAAKEAFFKALGTGWESGTHFHEIEILHDPTGKPGINLSGETQKTLSFLETGKISVSLSHIKTVASAIVIIEK